MLELLICSTVTILPDYLIRRYLQGKRIGHEITFFSVWYELRWGITLCAILAVALITMVFFYHPSTSNVRSYFRTVTILPESGGRVSEVHVKNGQVVEAGELLFRVDSSSQLAAVESAQSKVQEIDALLEVAESELAAAAAGVDQAKADFDLVEEDYLRSKALLDRGSGAVPQSEVDRLRNQMNAKQGALDAAKANRNYAEQKITVQLPSQRASAVASLAQAETELAKTEVFAGVAGRVQQFTLQVGDFVSPVLRPAGILVPTSFSGQSFVAGFDQLAASVVKPGMAAEITCMAKPFTIIPMVVVGVQDVIPAGQIRPTDNLIDPQDNPRPGTITVALEPLYEGQSNGIPPGSACFANAYTSKHEDLQTEDLSLGRWVFYHVVDTVGVVHAAGLRIRALLMPVHSLVFSGGH
jgi:multidrug resistance efflux pump